MTYLDLLFGQLVASAIKQLLEVLIEELEDERQLLVSVQNIDEAHDIRMLQLLEQSNFTDGCTGNALFLRLEANSLQRVNLICVHVSCFVHDTVSTLADLLQLLVLVNLRFHHFSTWLFIF